MLITVINGAALLVKAMKEYREGGDTAPLILIAGGDDSGWSCSRLGRSRSQLKEPSNTKVCAGKECKNSFVTLM